MNFDEMSLEELIESQRKDMRKGHLVDISPNTVSLDRQIGSGDSTLGEALLGSDGFIGMKQDRRRMNGCTLHRFQEMGKNGKCRICSRERYLINARRNGVRPRRGKDENGVTLPPPCDHDKSELTVRRDHVNSRSVSYRWVCKACDRDRKNASYHANREKILAQKKAKAKALRAQGLTSRGRPIKEPYKRLEGEGIVFLGEV